MGREFQSLAVRGKILMTHAIMQSFSECIFLEESVKSVEPVQIKIKQSNTYKKDIRWLLFEDEPRVQEK